MGKALEDLKALTAAVQENAAAIEAGKRELVEIEKELDGLSEKLIKAQALKSAELPRHEERHAELLGRKAMLTADVPKREASRDILEKEQTAAERPAQAELKAEHWKDFEKAVQELGRRLKAAEAAEWTVEELTDSVHRKFHEAGGSGYLGGGLPPLSMILTARGIRGERGDLVARFIDDAARAGIEIPKG